MLSFDKKLSIFSSVLNQDEKSYADSFNGLIFMYSKNGDYDFLHKLSSKQDIINWIERLKSRIVMHEDEAEMEDIIDDYIACG
ncbi:hypothetical protein [Candidatus Thiodubiliella endoseptemdiera]|uniref:hypothetical protein n=1 Tax=Candidatus Thiodubiliella endoseptemdiera TaxID=2738886 RepID=UPI0034DF0284